MQLSFFERGYAAKKKEMRRDRFLAGIEAVTSWTELVTVLQQLYSKGKRCPCVHSAFFL